MVTTESVLAAIGARSYSSAILTTYSFEPTFFELRVMSAMRRAGVRNVISLVDQGILAEVMESPAARSLDPFGSYALLPMGGESLWHPKVILLAGERSGLLAIGSGNLTSAGHGSNAELWSMIHVQDMALDNARLFAQLWDDLRSRCGHARGVVAQRLDWFEKYAPWLEEVRGNSSDIRLTVGGARVELATGTTMSPLEQFLGTLAGRSIKGFTVMSPYFDKNGHVLSSLLHAHPTGIVNVIVEDEWGSVPHGLAESEQRRCRFHRWSEVHREDTESAASKRARLHAKLLVAHLSDGAEVILFGSSNASLAGMGGIGSAPTNEEVNLILDRPRSNVLDELGISLRGASPLRLDQLRTGVAAEPSADRIRHRPIRLTLAEYDHPRVILHNIDGWEEPCCVVIEEPDGRKSVEQQLNRLDETQSIDVAAELPNGCFLLITSPDGTLLSARTLVQPVLGHHRCDPDKRYAKLESMLADVDLNELGRIEELLAFATFDEREEDTRTFSASRSGSRSEALAPDAGEVLGSYDEFMAPLRGGTNRGHGAMLSPTVRIADFLASITRRQMERYVDIDPLEQVGDATPPPNTEQKEVSPEDEQQNHAQQDSERHSIRRFLKKHGDWLAERIENSQSEVTLNDLSNALIASYLVLIFAGRRFKRRDGSWDEVEFVIDLSEGTSSDSLREFCRATLADLGLLLQRDLRNYEWESTNSRMRKFLRDGVINAIACFCRAYWSNLQRDEAVLILLNLLLVVHDVPDPEFETLLSERLRFGGKDNITRADVGKNRKLVKEIRAWVSAIANGYSKESVRGEQIRKGDLILKKGLGAVKVESTMHLKQGVYEIGYTRPGYCRSSKGRITHMKFDRLIREPNSTGPRGRAQLRR